MIIDWVELICDKHEPPQFTGYVDYRLSKQLGFDFSPEIVPLTSAALLRTQLV